MLEASNHFFPLALFYFSRSSPTKSFWLESTKGRRHYDDTSSSKRNGPSGKIYDHVIIGAGLSGVSTAYHLSKMGRETLLLDARGIAGGASGRNGGFVHPVEYSDLPDLLYRKPGKIHKYFQLAKLEQAGRKVLREKCEQGGLEGVLDLNVDAYMVFDEEDKLRDRLGPFFPLRNWLLPFFGIRCVQAHEYLRIRSDTKICKGGAIMRSKACDTICCAEFVSELARQGIELGLSVRTGVLVKEVVPLENGVLHIVGSKGETFKAKNVVYATNAFTPKILPEFKEKIVPIRNHVMVTKPVPSISKENNRRIGLSTQEGFHYMIQRPCGRVVIGGFRDFEKGFGVNKSNDSEVCLEVIEEMKSFLKENFEYFHENGVQVELAWTGIIGWSFDDTPWVGKLPYKNNEYIIAGFCGHGMTQTFMAGKALAEIISKKKPEYYVNVWDPNNLRTKTANFEAGHTEDE